MASEIRQFEVSTPAGTALAAPITTLLTMPARIVEAIRWRVPAGAKGELGWALAAAGTNIIPWNAGAWIVADDESDELTLENQITSGAWQVRSYNTGAFAHKVYFTFKLRPPYVAASALGGGLISLATLSNDTGSVVPPALVDGHAAARANAIAAVEDALGVPLDVVRQPLPAPLSQAALDYAATKQDALAALAAIVQGVTGPPPDAGDGYALGRANAVAAVQRALGGPVTAPEGTRPASGTPAALDYARARQAALTALQAIVAS